MQAPRPVGSLPRATQFGGVARTHPGLVRESNEDCFLIRDDAALWLVADGMGGHADGTIASAMVVDALAALELGGDLLAKAALIETCLQRVNLALRTRAESFGQGVIGTTIVALLTQPREYVCLWAGDSRAYVRREGRLMQITHDHSLVQELIDDGRLKTTDARFHPRLNVITRAVGAASDLTLERRRSGLLAGDVFLLCSDGLSGVLEDEEINATIGAHPIADAADILMACALRRGAPDNVTAVLVGEV